MTELRQYLMALVGCVALCGYAVANEPRQFLFGSAGVNGVYFPVTGAICRLMNAYSHEHGHECVVVSSGGSVHNLNGLRSNTFRVGIAQSDLHYQSYHGEGRFADQGAHSGLRSMFSVHAEPITIVARRELGAEQIEDLLGRRINIGPANSGTNATFGVLMDAMGLSESDFASLNTLRPEEQARALCEDRVDAIVYTVGHPSSAIANAISDCDGVLVSIDNEAVDALIDQLPYFRSITLPSSLYEGQDRAVTTFGVGATIVAAAETDETLVYEMTRRVFENFDDFSTIHPALVTLDQRQMATDGLTAPLHPGAARYFREVGLLED